MLSAGVLRSGAVEFIGFILPCLQPALLWVGPATAVAASGTDSAGRLRLDGYMPSKHLADENGLYRRETVPYSDAAGSGAAL